jgi:transcriptional regulator with XRE-family HTH domain
MLKTMLNREFVERVLTRRNISQNSLAKRLRISSGYMSLIMNGDRYVSAKMRRRICRYFRRYDFNDVFTIIDVDKKNDESGPGRNQAK